MRHLTLPVDLHGWSRFVPERLTRCGPLAWPSAPNSESSYALQGPHPVCQSLGLRAVGEGVDNAPNVIS